MNRITPFTLQQNIATDNAFSTIQVIHQIKAKMDEVIDIVNGIETDAHEYTDAKVLELSNRIDGEISSLENIVRDNNQRVSEINARVVILESDLAELNNLLFTKYAELDSKITDEKNARIQADMATLADAINYTDSEINKLKAWVEEVINDRTAYAYSSWDGSWKPISEVLNDNNKFTGLKRSRYMSLELLDYIENRCGFYYGVYPIVNFSEYTLDELDAVLSNLDTLGGSDTISMRTTSTASPSVIGGIYNTLDDFAVNNFNWMYYIWYKIGRNRDVSGSYVTWYSIFSALNTQIGFTNITYNNDFTVSTML